MAQGTDTRLFDLPLGPARRAIMRQLKMPIGIDDFSDEEWCEIETEAPGTRAFIESQFADG